MRKHLTVYISNVTGVCLRSVINVRAIKIS